MIHHRFRRDQWREALGLVRCGAKFVRWKHARPGMSKNVRRAMALRGDSFRLMSRRPCAPRYWMRGEGV